MSILFYAKHISFRNSPLCSFAGQRNTNIENHWPLMLYLSQVTHKKLLGVGQIVTYVTLPHASCVFNEFELE